LGKTEPHLAIVGTTPEVEGQPGFHLARVSGQEASDIETTCADVEVRNAVFAAAGIGSNRRAVHRDL
jgi:hypothetical protein